LTATSPALYERQMRILIVGGAGYIGSHTARHLSKKGHDVVALDDLSTGHIAALSGLPLVHLDLVSGDLTSFLAAGRFDAVMHFAARCIVPESVAQPSIYWRTNVLGTLRLLDAMVARGPRRLVFSSTCATYGIPTEVPIPEAHPKAPINAYGKSKLAVEHALDDYARAHGLGAIALRYFNAAGAASDGSHGEDHAQETHLIPLALGALLGGPPLRVTGTDYPTPDGTCIRDYVHVDDLARAHALALERIEPGTFSAFNIGTGAGHSVREVIDTIEKVTRRALPRTDAPRRPGDPPKLVARAETARTHLDFTPERSLEDIVTSAWRWHESHPRGYAG
jgi:UDP-glucose 4-epimerase